MLTPKHHKTPLQQRAPDPAERKTPSDQTTVTNRTPQLQYTGLYTSLTSVMGIKDAFSQVMLVKKKKTLTNVSSNI